MAADDEEKQVTNGRDDAGQQDEIRPAHASAPHAANAQNPFEPDYENIGIERSPEDAHPRPVQAVPTGEKAEPEERNKLSKIKIILIAVAAAVVILALALGVGLGVGLKRNQTSSAPAPSAPAQGVINDSSLAAIIMPDGNRHLLFQAGNGSLRHTSFDNITGNWNSSATYIFPPYSNSSAIPRNNTPIAAIQIDQPDEDPPFFHIFYVSKDGKLAATPYTPSSGNDDLTTSPIVDDLNVKTGSRSMVLTKMVRFDPDSIAEAFLMYETPDGNVTTLRGYLHGDTAVTAQWKWYNISQTLWNTVEQSNTSTWLSAPFAADIAPFSSDIAQGVNIVFFNPLALTDKTQPSMYYILYANWTGLLPSTPPLPSNPNSFSDPGPDLSSLEPVDPPLGSNSFASSIQISDVIVASGADYEPPNSSHSSTWDAVGYVADKKFYWRDFPPTEFPYARVAWLNSTNMSANLIYHQKDGGSLWEDAWVDGKGWVSGVEIRVGV